MRTGNHRFKVSLQRQSTAVDAAGQKLDTWTTYASRRADIEPISGREYFQASGEKSQITTRITLRYDATAATTKPYDRIVYGSDVYDVESVINTRNRNRELVMMCKLRTPG